MNSWFIGIVIFVSILAILDYSDKQQARKYYATNYNNSYSTKTTYDKSQNATALCRDGTYSYSANRRGTCSHHGGVKYWLNDSQSIPTTTPTYTYIPPTPTHPTNAVAQCVDGTYSYSINNVCGNHGGVKIWLNGYQAKPSQSDTMQPVQNPFTTTEPTQNIQQNEQPQPTFTIEQAKQMYEQKVANINQVWQSLDPTLRENLRPEQRAINKQRENECTTYSQTQSDVPEIQQAYRYLCEVPRLQERTKYLQKLLNTQTIKLAG